MRKALVVGIDYYTQLSGLHGCVNDAHAVKAILERHGDGSVNFGVKLLTATSAKDAISRGALKDNIEELFKDDSDIALLYFAGHGHIETTGGYLLPSDANRGDEGVPLGEIMTFANRSKAKNKVIVLDSCHSGIAGTPPNGQNAELSEGMTILAASTDEQYASEQNGVGLFTSLFVDAMSGGAANLVGEISPGTVYAHIDKSLGAWKQRPVFKTNVKNFITLRKVEPPIPLADLRRLTEFFPQPGFEYGLDPSYEPEMKGRDPGMPDPDPVNTAKFAILQKYNRLNLLVLVGASQPHPWHAAMESKACKLTVTGELWRGLVARGLI